MEHAEALNRAGVDAAAGAQSVRRGGGLLLIRLALVAAATLAAWLAARAVDGTASFPPTPLLASPSLLPVNIISLLLVSRLLRIEGQSLRSLFAPGRSVPRDAQSRLSARWPAMLVCSLAFGAQHAFFAPTTDAMIVYVAAFTFWGLGSALIVRAHAARPGVTRAVVSCGLVVAAHSIHCSEESGPLSPELLKLTVSFGGQLVDLPSRAGPAVLPLRCPATAP